VIAWVPCGTGIVLTNVVFPTRQDHDGLWVPVQYLVVLAVLALAGMTSASRGQRIAAGALAGTILGLLTIATFGVVDNAFLPIIGEQQAKIDGLRDSGMTSMRAYLNHSLLPAGVFMTVNLAFIGLFGAVVGGTAYDDRARRRRHPHHNLTP